MQEEIISKILEDYEFGNYKLIQNSFGHTDILMSFWGKCYKIQLQEDEKYSLLCRNEAQNRKQKERYHCIGKFEGSDFLIKVLKYLKKDIPQKQSNSMKLLF